MWEDTVAQLEKDQADPIRSLFLLASQIETELKTRVEQIEIVDTLLSNLLESVRYKQEGSEGRAAQRDKDVKRLSSVVRDLKKKLREADECNTN